MRNALFCLAAAVLSACATQEQIAAGRYREQQRADARQAAYTEGLWNQCRAMGYQPGTDGFRQCVLRLHNQNGTTAVQMGPLTPDTATRQRDIHSIP
ncbi:MAG TPA: hypothetical protein VMN03_10815, partial [Burkholderiales bacterium]|nr:hypothetical protein [Burkholderiales bacterium]